MLNGISWSEFWMVLIPLALIYYIGYAITFYKEEIASLLGKKDPAPNPENQGFVKESFENTPEILAPSSQFYPSEKEKLAPDQNTPEKKAYIDDPLPSPAFEIPEPNKEEKKAPIKLTGFAFGPVGEDSSRPTENPATRDRNRVENLSNLSDQAMEEPSPLPSVSDFFTEDTSKSHSDPEADEKIKPLRVVRLVSPENQEKPQKKKNKGNPPVVFDFSPYEDPKFT